MAAKVAIFYIAIFVFIFLSKMIWSKALAKFGMESIIFFLSVAFPVIATLIALIQISLNWGKENIIGAELVALFGACYSSYFLYRRSKGLEAVFGVSRMKPSDGNIGCLSDFLMVGITLVFLAMGAFVSLLKA